MYHARGIVAAAKTASGEQQREIAALSEGNESTKLWAENWYDGLTYCKYTKIFYAYSAHWSFRYLECSRTTTH
jgi:hypothetical protein